MADSIKISLELADAAAQKALSDFISQGNKADKGMKKLGDTGSDTFKEIAVHIGKSIGVFDIFAGNIAANIVTSAFDSMTQAAGSLFQTFIIDGVRAAQESEDAINALNVALAQSGDYSREVSLEFQEFAAQLQKTTAFEDGAIIKNTALLASLTKLDKDGLKAASKAAVELSAALGKDLETTTEAIAKAANGNTTSIQKMGIEFQKTGTKAGTFQNILTAIETQFGGSATSKLNTFSGSVARASNAFGDLQETIGSLITENPAVISAINEIGKIINGTSDNLYDNRDSYKILVAEGFVAIIQGSKQVVEAFELVGKAGVVSFQLVKGAINTILPGMDQFLKLAGVAGKIFGDVAPVIQGASGQAQTLETPLKGIADNLGRIGQAAQEGLDKLKSGAESSAGAIKNSGKAVNELSEAQKRAVSANDSYVQGLADENLSIKGEFDKRLQTITAFYEQASIIEDQSATARVGLDQFDQRLNAEREFYEQKTLLLEDQRAKELERIDQSTLDEETKRQARLTAENKFRTDMLKAQADFNKKEVQLESDKNRLKEQNQRDTFATIATLSSSNNRTLATIGKAAGITQIAIDTPVAVSKALAAFPPPFNFAAASLVGAAMAAQAAQLAGVRFEDGGIVPGTSFAGDRVQARVNSGEMILNKQQQATLFDLANGQGGGGVREEILMLRDSITGLLSQPLVIQVDGRELINITRSQVLAGRSI